jgi:hypothetical protein
LVKLTSHDRSGDHDRQEMVLTSMNLFSRNRSLCDAITAALLNRQPNMSNANKVIVKFCAPAGLALQANAAAEASGMTRSAWIYAVLRKEIYGTSLPSHSADFLVYKELVYLTRLMGEARSIMLFLRNRVNAEEQQDIHVVNQIDRVLEVNQTIDEMVLKLLLQQERKSIVD